MELVRYIHLNLIRWGMVKGLGELNRSPWAGHSALMGYQKREWQDTEYGWMIGGIGIKEEGRKDGIG